MAFYQAYIVLTLGMAGAAWLFIYFQWKNKRKEQDGH